MNRLYCVCHVKIVQVEKRNGNHTMASNSSEHQGLKRLKKLQHEKRSGQSMPSDCSRNDEPNRNTNRASNYKESPENTLKDRYGRSNLPISIKYKKLGNEEAMIRQREHHRNDRLKHEVGKYTREPPPLENGPKRIKVRGPTYVGSESSLD